MAKLRRKSALRGREPFVLLNVATIFVVAAVHGGMKAFVVLLVGTVGTGLPLREGIRQSLLRLKTASDVGRTRSSDVGS
jgi:hypothetical protein